MTSTSIEQEDFRHWLFADRVTRYWLVPALLLALLIARFLGLSYPAKPCALLVLIFILYNRWFIRFLRHRSRLIADTEVYLAVLLLNTVTLGAAIHFSGGVESVLTPLTAAAVIFGALFLSFGGCLCVSFAAGAAYALVVWFEYAGLLPHYHIFPALNPLLYRDTAYVTLTGFGVVLVVVTLGLMAGYLATLRRLHSERLTQLQLRLQEWNRDLELHVEEKTRNLRTMHEQLQQAYLGTVRAFMQALGAKDPYTRGHSHAVATYAKLIAEELGIEGERLERLIQGCELHDIGKIAVPDHILLKPGPLTKEEYEIVKQHPTWGARILGPLTFMKDVTEIVRQEHERWDGRGYPAALKGEEICLEARIVAVADAWDAMRSRRPYRAPMALEAAVGELTHGAGTQFDPIIVEAFLRAIEKGRLREMAPIEDVTAHLDAFPDEAAKAADQHPHTS